MSDPDLRKPLSEVPVGDMVARNGQVLRVKPGLRVGNKFLTTGEVEELVSTDTPVLHLEGAQPRPLRGGDEGRWVLVDPSFEGNTVLRRPILIEGLGNNSWRCFGDWLVGPDWPVWPIIPPQSEPTEDAETAPRWSVDGDGHLIVDARYATIAERERVADHLNTSGPDGGPWVPEPERPSARQAIQSAGVLVEEVEAVLYALDHHGYHVVDVQALGDAIAWLRYLKRTDPPQSGRRYDCAATLLTALGVSDA